MHMARILADMPDLWHRILTEHVSDSHGRCVVCRDRSGAAAPWPCVTVRDPPGRRRSSGHPRGEGTGYSSGGAAETAAGRLVVPLRSASRQPQSGSSRSVTSTSVQATRCVLGN